MTEVNFTTNAADSVYKIEFQTTDGTSFLLVKEVCMNILENEKS